MCAIASTESTLLSDLCKRKDDNYSLSKLLLETQKGQITFKKTAASRENATELESMEYNESTRGSILTTHLYLISA